MEQEFAPSLPEPAPVRPKRRTLFLRGIGDILLFLISFLVLGVILVTASAGDVVNREDRWRFETMAANEDALLIWAESQPDLIDFRAERQPDNRLLLRYQRKRADGPANPDWGWLGYRRAYLESASPVDIPCDVSSLSKWAVSMAAFLAAGVLAVRRIQRARRAGAPVVAVADRPGEGWWRPLLFAFVVMVVFTAGQEDLIIGRFRRSLARKPAGGAPGRRGRTTWAPSPRGGRWYG